MFSKPFNNQKLKAPNFPKCTFLRKAKAVIFLYYHKLYSMFIKLLYTVEMKLGLFINVMTSIINISIRP